MYAAVIAGLKAVRSWYVAVDEKGHEYLAKLDALIAKLEGTFGADNSLSEADAAAVEEAFGAIQDAA
jgi:hypothetical protein